ncbi:MAG TPA: VIT and VWA domain-containing protein [Anaeromyxobacter sp.]|nr:VIT and VWA domain-containing protein [Anaeromyxobacter sp.]
MHTPKLAIPWLIGLAALALAFEASGDSSAKKDEEVSPAEALRRAVSSSRQPMQLAEEEARPEAGRTLAPYFVVLSGEAGEGERLPLKETRATASIAGPIARVQVRQVFQNRGPRPIEACYVFPASSRAAVHGMRLQIEGRTVEARIERRERARLAYEAARSDGKRAALLDEERANVFTMRVANIMPGEQVVAELDYSELIVPEEGVYELVYPTVVGPRYGGHADPARDGWIENPTLPEGSAAPYRFGFTAHLESAFPVGELSSPSHALRVSWRSPRSADVALRDEGGGNRDLVLRWRLSGEAVEAGALLFPGEDGGGYFLAAIEPPARVRPEEIPPREYVFVLDVSGSMNGFPLETAKALAHDLLPRLRPVDYVNAVFFSGGSFVLSPGGSLPATPGNLRRALAAFDRLEGGGGTELLQALETAYDLPRPDRRVARSVVVVTDGYVGVEAQVFRLVRERLSEASCFAFGIGTAVNRALIEGLARAGQGEPTIVLSPRDAPAAAARLERIIAAPVLTQLRYEVVGFEARDVLPGALPDLLAERPVTLLGRYRGVPGGRIVLTGQSAAGPFRREIDLSAAIPRPENGPLRVLWARRWVDLLLDEHHLGPAPEIEEAVTDLGLAHHLLTPFTSFVAVDSEVVNRGGAGDLVRQPLPLPEGVSNLAVGGEPSAAPAEAPERAAVLSRRLQAAPPPAAKGAMAEDREKDLVQGPRREDAAVIVVRESQTGLPAISAVREAVRTALGRLVARGLHGEVELVLTLDGSGTVVQAEVLEAPDDAARSLMVEALRGLQIGVRPVRPKGSATYRVLARIGRAS